MPNNSLGKVNISSQMGSLGSAPNSKLTMPASQATLSTAALGKPNNVTQPPAGVGNIQQAPKVTPAPTPAPAPAPPAPPVQPTAAPPVTPAPARSAPKPVAAPQPATPAPQAVSGPSMNAVRSATPAQVAQHRRQRAISRAQDRAATAAQQAARTPQQAQDASYDAETARRQAYATANAARSRRMAQQAKRRELLSNSAQQRASDRRSRISMRKYSSDNLTPFAKAFLERCESKGMDQQQFEDAVKFASAYHPAAARELGPLMKQANAFSGFSRLINNVPDMVDGASTALRSGAKSMFGGADAASDAATAATKTVPTGPRPYPGAIPTQPKVQAPRPYPGAIPSPQAAPTPQPTRLNKAWQGTKDFAAGAGGSLGHGGAAAMLHPAGALVPLAGGAARVGKNIPWVGKVDKAMSNPALRWATGATAGVGAAHMGLGYGLGKINNEVRETGKQVANEYSQNIGNMFEGVAGEQGAEFGAQFQRGMSGDPEAQQWVNTRLKSYAGQLMDATGAETPEQAIGITAKLVKAFQEGDFMTLISHGWQNMSPNHKLAITMGGGLLLSSLMAMISGSTGTGLTLGTLGSIATAGGLGLFDGVAESVANWFSPDPSVNAEASGSAGAHLTPQRVGAPPQAGTVGGNVGAGAGPAFESRNEYQAQA